MDSLTFGAIPTDKAMERCPDGTGSFKITAKPTYNLPNCGIVQNTDVVLQSHFKLNPNPAGNFVELISEVHSEIQNIKIINQLGSIVMKIRMQS